jgi:DNA-binding LytR/AlgR family response regulator
MRVVIIEDEKPAIIKLESFLNKYDENIEIIARLNSVEDSLKWLKSSKDLADLFFMDIRLKDGLSLDIFEQFTINKPIIFITAYNQYAIDAFKFNSIDYLLKPLSYEDLCRSMEKINLLRDNLPSNENNRLSDLSRMLLQLNKTYKSRFLTKVGDHIKSVKAENILLFFAEGRTVYIITSKNNKFIIDYTLEELEKHLDPDMFFRANRTFIVNINAIKDVLIYSNSRLRILLNIEFEKEIIVSRDKVSLLKIWFEGIK